MSILFNIQLMTNILDNIISEHTKCTQILNNALNDARSKKIPKRTLTVLKTNKHFFSNWREIVKSVTKEKK